MTTPFLPIPDWCSFENQGGNIASADLTNSGRADLVVLMVDVGAGFEARQQSTRGLEQYRQFRREILLARIAPLRDEAKIVAQAIKVEINIDPEQIARIDTVLKTLVGHREHLERKKLFCARNGNGAHGGKSDDRRPRDRFCLDATASE